MEDLRNPSVSVLLPLHGCTGTRQCALSASTYTSAMLTRMLCAPEPTATPVLWPLVCSELQLPFSTGCELGELYLCFSLWGVCSSPAALLSSMQMLFHCYLSSFCRNSDIRTDGVKLDCGQQPLLKARRVGREQEQGVGMWFLSVRSHHEGMSSWEGLIC